uniref:CD96 molecule n=1 Tax=Molossus molossus TaxID=27622 RepID=A0A7J8HZ25_MOLMO|nr:CD96 molecule [Molossus molossus]
MEKTWTYCAVYSIIQIHFVRGLWEEKIKTEDIYASPGSDVNLTCQTQKKGFMVQTQWSKITKRVDLVALYHPQHGFHCADGVPFTLDEWRSNNTMEIEINRTLKIPCLQNISSEISSEFTFAWLVEDNGTQETLITQGHPISNSTLFKDRVKLGADYGLYLSPVQIHDNDRRFSCHVTIRPGKILRSSTTVKVFGKRFCFLDSLPSSCPCHLPQFSPREAAACCLECSHAKVAIPEFCLPWYLSFLLGVGMRV